MATTSIERKRDYHHWLPGLHARYQLDKDTQLRAAWTKSVVRPTFGQLAPGFVIDGDEASFGNPDLSPLESSNLDLGIEHYLGRAGVVSAFLFYKDIDNFIYNTDLAGTGAWATFDEANTYANGDSAKLYGLELAYSRRSSTGCPRPGTAAAGRQRHLQPLRRQHRGLRRRQWPHPRARHRPAQPVRHRRQPDARLGEHTLSLRLSANYKSDYLFEVAPVGDRQHDLHVDAQTFVDFSARYFLTKELQLSFEAQNLTDEHYYVYTGAAATTPSTRNTAPPTRSA